MDVPSSIPTHLEECPICLERTSDVTLPCCQTDMCSNCITRLIADRCPFCCKPFDWNSDLWTIDKDHVKEQIRKNSEEAAEEMRKHLEEEDYRVALQTQMQDSFNMLAMSSLLNMLFPLR